MSVRHFQSLRVLPQIIEAPRPTDRASVEVYRPFFLSGILSVLTAGCLLGAVALFGISAKGSYVASAWTPYVLAHANSQLYGWVGFFVMGFALQHHSPSHERLRLFHQLALSSLILMGVGIALRFAAEPLAAVDPAVWVPIGVVSCLMQTLAVLLFVTNTSYTRHRTGDCLPWQSALVFASLFWMVVVAVAEPFYFANSHVANPEEAILFVAKWFPPYREAQFLGFVAMMIFGVALVKMNSCFAIKPATAPLALAGFAVWTFGLFLRMGGWVRGFDQGMSSQAMRPYFWGAAALALGACLLVAATRVFERANQHLPSHKFVRASLSWLLIAGVLMVLEPAHLSAIGHPFSHAFIGAVRHAATVGFISQMIIGVSLRVVTRMRDVPDNRVPELWATFWLLNLGNAARVVLEIATDYTPSAFAPMGITGFIELVGLVLWARYVAPLLLSERFAQLNSTLASKGSA